MSDNEKKQYTRTDLQRSKREVKALFRRELGVRDSQGALAILRNPSEPNDRRLMASMAISGPIPQGSVLWIVDRLRSDDEVETWQAASTLAGIEGRTATKRLVEILEQGPRNHNRMAAIHVLQRWRDPRSVPALVCTATDPGSSEGVRAKTYDALGDFSGQSQARKALLSGLLDASPNIRHHCLVGISPQVVRPTVKRAVAKLVNDKGISWEGYCVGDVARRILGNFGRVP